MSKPKPIAYELVPVYPDPPGAWASAAVVVCALSGRYLSGSGGGGVFLAPEIVDEIRAGKLRYVPDEQAGTP